MGVPIITFTNDRTIISKLVTCTVKFKVNENWVEFEARATRNGDPFGRGIGALIMGMKMNPPNYYPANAEYTYVIKDTNLTSGQGIYRISMYAKNVTGVWSDVEAFTWNGTDKTGWDFGTWV